jgi:hypothetical protein
VQLLSERPRNAASAIFKTVLNDATTTLDCNDCDNNTRLHHTLQRLHACAFAPGMCQEPLPRTYDVLNMLQNWKIKQVAELNVVAPQTTWLKKNQRCCSEAWSEGVSALSCTPPFSIHQVLSTNKPRVAPLFVAH